jgi:hypothetical protein
VQDDAAPGRGLEPQARVRDGSDDGEGWEVLPAVVLELSVAA